MSKRKPNPSKAAAPESLTYEQAVAELELIIDQMESGETPLEESLVDYERGVGLLKRCREILARAEQKIEYLKTSAESRSDPSEPGPAAPRHDDHSDHEDRDDDEDAPVR